jgi:nucleoside-triphosphatase
MRKHIILITGIAGIGKTTAIIRAVETLKGQGYDIGGMITKEKREGYARVGFEIQDLATQKLGWLAHVKQPNGPRIGKYRVNLSDLEDVGANAIQNATKTADIIVIDEIGPMELHSKAFKEAVVQASDSAKPVVATVHYNAADDFVRDIKTRQDAEVYEVTSENRETIHNLITERITNILSRQQEC